MAWFFLILALILLIVIFSIGLTKGLKELKKHWVPALITGIFIVGILPIANQFYWIHRKNFEKTASDCSKRYELISSTAKTYSLLFKIHTRLHQLAQERTRIENDIQKLDADEKASTNVIRVKTAHLAALYALRSDLEKERIQLEGQLGGISGIILNYFPAEISEKFNEVALLYDKSTSAPKPFIPNRKDPVVNGVTELVAEMATKVKEYESK